MDTGNCLDDDEAEDVEQDVHGPGADAAGALPPEQHDGRLGQQGGEGGAGEGAAAVHHPSAAGEDFQCT